MNNVKRIRIFFLKKLPFSFVVLDGEPSAVDCVINASAAKGYDCPCKTGYAIDTTTGKCKVG